MEIGRISLRIPRALSIMLADARYLAILFPWLISLVSVVADPSATTAFVSVTLVFLPISILYFITESLPTIEHHRWPRPIRAIMPLIDWTKRVLQDSWTAYAVAVFVIYLLVADSVTLKTVVFLVFIAFLIRPPSHRDHQELHLDPGIESAPAHPLEAILDGRTDTVWQSTATQQPGWGIEVWFSRLRYLTTVAIDYGTDIQSRPGKLRILLSTSAGFVAIEQPRRTPHHTTEDYRLPEPIPCTKLRLEIEQPNTGATWQIANLDLGFSFLNRTGTFAWFIIALAFLLAGLQWIYGTPAISNRQILTIGSGVHGSPSVHPNGRRILFDSDQGSPDTNQLFVYDRVTGAVQPLLSDSRPEYKEWHGVFGSKGQVVFASNRKTPLNPQLGQIYLFEPVNSSVTQLTTSSNAMNDWPDISPDGKNVVFQSAKENDSISQLFLQSLEGGAPIQLTGMRGGVQHPRFSPDGQTIIFASRQDSSSYWSLATISKTPDGWSRVAKSLLSPPFDVFHPSYAPDGKRIVFVSDMCGATGIAIAQTQDVSSSLGWITFLWDSDPVMTRDDRLVYTTASEGNWQLAMRPVPKNARPFLPFPLDCIGMGSFQLAHSFSVWASGARIDRAHPLSGRH